jgi:hypothetical protein
MTMTLELHEILGVPYQLSSIAQLVRLERME